MVHIFKYFKFYKMVKNSTKTFKSLYKYNYCISIHQSLNFWYKSLILTFWWILENANYVFFSIKRNKASNAAFFCFIGYLKADLRELRSKNRHWAQSTTFFITNITCMYSQFQKFVSIDRVYADIYLLILDQLGVL